MRLAIRIAACFCFAATGVLLSACSGVKIGTVPLVTTPINTQPPVEAGLPVVLTAQQLGQEGYDDPPGTVHKYLNSTLEVTGVVSSQDAPNSAAPPGPNEPIGGVVFKI